ncbi:MAG: ACP S-malonyltransferase [Planctomycetota bacterium]
MRAGLLLPGQGAQKVGMGADFAAVSPAAKALFERADSLLGLELSRVCFEGPAEELTRTDMAQPAIFTCSLAALAALEEGLGPLSPAGAAGLSLGEYTALSACGALSFEDGLRLVRLRGREMQAASEALASGMTSVLGLEPGPVRELCTRAARETGGICQVANLNSPGQVVASGEIPALERLEVLAREAGARRALRLQVAGAFHSEVMRPAARKLEQALGEVEIRPPRCPVWQNATACPETDPGRIRENLTRQLTAPVLWEASFRRMAESLGEVPFLEPAPGRVLAGLARKIVPAVRVLSLADEPSRQALLAEAPA